MRGIRGKHIFVFLLFINGVALAYMTDTRIYAPPSDYTAPLEPRTGYAYRYRDPVFNPVSQSADWIWRATDARNTRDVNGTNLKFITHEYSTTNPSVITSVAAKPRLATVMATIRKNSLGGKILNNIHPNEAKKV